MISMKYFRLKRSFQDEVTVLEERYDAEKEKFVEQREIELLKEHLQRVKVFPSEKQGLILESIIKEMPNPSNIYGPIRTQPEKESDAKYQYVNECSLIELKEVSQLSDEKDLFDSGDEHELVQGLRDQYEMRLKKETELLMKRLLELSDELDMLRSSH